MKFNELGRSMVEMLGVLAIIGVLSVGAISGYSTAMTKYKLNKQAEQINWLMSNILPYGTQLGNEGDMDYGNENYQERHLLPILKKLNIIPEEMISDATPQYIWDAMGTRIRILSVQDSPDRPFFYQMDTEPERSSRSIMSCRNLITIWKGYSANLTKVTAYNQSTGNDVDRLTFYGDKECNKNVICLKDVTLSQIEEACTVCKEDKLACYLIAIWNA